MIKVRNLILQMTQTEYDELLLDCRNKKQTLLIEALVLYREQILDEPEMVKALNIPSDQFNAINRALKKNIFDYLSIDTQDYRYSLINRVELTISRSYCADLEEETTILHYLLDELSQFQLDFYATSLYERLAHLNCNNSNFNKYNKKFKRALEIKQTTERCMILFSQLNSKIDEYTEEPCKIYLNHINQSLNEIDAIHNEYKNAFTNTFHALAHLLVSVFVKDSLYATTHVKSIEKLFVESMKKIALLASGTEQYYACNILKLISIRMKSISNSNASMQVVYDNLIESKEGKIAYNFNFSAVLKNKLIAEINTNQRNTTTNKVVVSIKEKIKEKIPFYGYYNNSFNLSKLIYRSTAYS